MKKATKLDRVVLALILKDLGRKKGIRGDDPRLLTECFSDEEIAQTVMQVQAMSHQEKVNFGVACEIVEEWKRLPEDQKRVQ